MTAEELATALVKRYARQCRDYLGKSPRDYGDPFDNGMTLVVWVAVETAFGFTEREATKYIRIVSAEEEV